MFIYKKDNQCRRLQEWFGKLIAEKLILNRRWIQNHIANCPKCQQRTAHLGRVDFALSLLKSEPHSIELLMRANTQAISVLKHALRKSAQAGKLRQAKPEPGILDVCVKYKQPLFNAAACILIAVLMKASVFSSGSRFQAQSQKAVENYYAKNIGDDLTREIFSNQA
jgi:hypothetical protein